MLPLERPDAFADVVLEFLAGVEATLVARPRATGP
jgi:hypothetical protein